MINGYFYNRSIRKYVILLTNLFSHIQVQRDRGNITVPISYASKERFIAKLNHMDMQNDIARVETILPRMSVYMTNMTYDPTRKTNVSNRKLQRNDTENRPALNTQFNAVPYNFDFEIGIYTRHQDDMFQIIEQILPYFQPAFVCKIKELDENELIIDERDIPITIETIQPEEDYEGDSGSRRRIEWTISVQLKGWIYPGTNNTFGEIRTIYLNFNDEKKETVEINTERDTVTSSLDIRYNYTKPVSNSINIGWDVNTPRVKSHLDVDWSRYSDTQSGTHIVYNVRKQPRWLR